ncbi:hypothetical protein [Desulfosoma caldarium]|uniref:hypothetical protein n=1 Tax=Desulfosoma caldarium TaxID=610254 RepID=UPI0011CD5B10|nr:hypothetical protein [Desulfosoma caldarium]
MEVSPFAVRFRLKHGRFLLKLLLQNLHKATAMTRIPVALALRSPFIQPILRQCTLPFEYRAAFQRFREIGTPLFCVDTGEASRLFVADWPEMLSSENLARLLTSSLPSPLSAADEYALARRALTQAKPGAQRRHWNEDFTLRQQREAWLEKTVRATLERLQPSPLVYLGGWRHVVPDAGQSLYDRLCDLNPCPLLLDQADEGPRNDFNP